MSEKTSCETMNCPKWDGKNCTGEDYFNEQGESVCERRDDALFTQEQLCEYCEENIIRCRNMSSTFMCEGGYCEEAKESYVEYLKDKDDE